MSYRGDREKKNRHDVENNTAVALAGSNDVTYAALLSLASVLGLNVSSRRNYEIGFGLDGQVLVNRTAQMWLTVERCDIVRV